MAYAPNIDGSTVRTLAEWGTFFKKDGKAHNIIELVNAENTILDDIPWKEATDLDGNQTALRTALPTPYWRKLYKGVPPSKSRVTIVKDPIGRLESRSLVDAAFKEIYGAQFAPYRLSEAKAHMEAMRQEVATALFYGNVKDNPEGIHGFAPRYAYKNGPHVVDAGGTGAALTSIFGVVWGENEAMGIFPRESSAGLSHKDLGEADALDGDGNAFRAISDLYVWHVGLSVRDWRSVVRICNIPVGALVKAKGDSGFIDLHRLTIMAKNKIPPEKRARMRWYVNQEVMTALELQATDAGHVNLHYGDLFNSKGIPFLHGAAVRQCDALLTTEEALPASA